MIRVVGANPAMDRIAVWPPVRLGAVNRATEVLVLAGGKGMNVCRGIRTLGGEVAAYGFVGGEVGASIRRGCLEAGIEDRLTSIAGETRVTMVVVEPEAGRSTVLNEPGPTVTEAEGEQLLEALARDCVAGDLLVLTGTLPRGLPPSLVAAAVRLGRAAGCRVILDSSGPTLRAGVDESPWMLKCNAGEFAALEAAFDPSGVATPPADPLALVPQARGLLARGIGAVVVTLGHEGLMSVTADEVLRVHPPAVAAVNPTGAGDLLLAALAVRLAEDTSLADALTFATACAAGSVARLAPEIPPLAEVERLLRDVRVERLAG